MLANRPDRTEDTIMTSHSGNARGSSGWGGLGRSSDGKGPHSGGNHMPTNLTFSKPHISFQASQGHGRRDAAPEMVLRLEAVDDEESDRETTESGCTPNDSFTKFIFTALAAQYPESRIAALLRKEQEQATVDRNVSVWKWLEEAN